MPLLKTIDPGYRTDARRLPSLGVKFTVEQSGPACPPIYFPEALLQALFDQLFDAYGRDEVRIFSYVQSLVSQLTGQMDAVIVVTGIYFVNAT